MQNLGQKLLRLSPVIRYSSRQAFDEDVAALRTEGFRCIEYDCSGWTLHTNIYHEIVAPVQRLTGELGGWPGVEEFFDMFRSEGAGTVFVFRGWELFARADRQAWAILDNIAISSRHRLIVADWLFALVLVSDMHLKIGPVGAVPVPIRQLGQRL